jgi:hypothetical protein
MNRVGTLPSWCVNQNQLSLVEINKHSFADIILTHCSHQMGRRYTLHSLVNMSTPAVMLHDQFLQVWKDMYISAQETW